MAKHKSASLSIKNLHTHYELSHVLQGINLKVPHGEVTAIVGRNGVGKTTLINSIIGILNVTEGSVILERNKKMVELIGFPSYTRKKHGIAIVPQGRRLFRSLTVEEHLNLVNPISEGPNNLDSIFKMFPILHERKNSDANTLSGGEQSMLAIARALILNPDVILMDEPTEGLAPLLVNLVAEVILELKEQGITILLVEQKLKFALDVSDTISIMERGIIAETIPREKIVDVNILIEKIMGK